jgi:hypothetical protein
MRNLLAITLLTCFAALLSAGSALADEPIVTSEPAAVDGPILGDGHVEPGHVNLLPRFWVEADYLLLWTKSQPLPSLVTTGPTSVLGPAGTPGVIGGFGTSTLLGGTPVRYDPGSGVRVLLGSWLDHDCCIGAEASYFFVDERGYQRSLSQPGVPGTNALSIPFFNPNIAQESSVAVAFPRAVSPIGGQVILSVSTRLQGWEANGIFKVIEKPHARTDLLVGYRQLALDEGLYFDTSSSNVGQADIFRTSDSFRCSNDFHGLQVGVRQQVYYHKIYFRGAAKLALGNMHQTTTIDGSLTTNDLVGLGGQTRTFRGGYLALPTNIGRVSTDRFAFIPEVTGGVGLHVTDCLRVTASYTFMYLTTVVRPGDQISRTINPTQGQAYTGNVNSTLTGPAVPTYPGRTTDYMIQGLNVGLEVRF